MKLLDGRYKLECHSRGMEKIGSPKDISLTFIIYSSTTPNHQVRPLYASEYNPQAGEVKRPVVSYAPHAPFFRVGIIRSLFLLRSCLVALQFQWKQS